MWAASLPCPASPHCFPAPQPGCEFAHALCCIVSFSTVLLRLALDGTERQELLCPAQAGWGIGSTGEHLEGSTGSDWKGKLNPRMFQAPPGHPKRRENSSTGRQKALTWPHKKVRSQPHYMDVDISLGEVELLGGKQQGLSRTPPPPAFPCILQSSNPHPQGVQQPALSFSLPVGQCTSQGVITLLPQQKAGTHSRHQINITRTQEVQHSLG